MALFGLFLALVVAAPAARAQDLTTAPYIVTFAPACRMTPRVLF